MLDSFYHRFQSSLLFPITVLLLIVGTVYAFFIVSVPHFFADDYYIFSIISNNPSSPITLNFYEKYSLALRPISYGFFWLQYHLFDTNATLMKFFSLIALAVYGVSTIIALKYILNFFEVAVSNVMLLLGGLFVTLHPDMVISVLWISNVNELLMCLFYVLALIIFFGFQQNIIRSSLYVGLLLVVFYLLSIFAKQQSLHLPLLFLFLLVAYRHKFEARQRTTLIAVTIIMMVFFLLALILNTKMYFLLSEEDHVPILTTLIKKPFALIGNIAITYIPNVGVEIYDYFIQHKMFAGIVCAVGVLLLVILMLRKKSIVAPISMIVTFILIISFPRIIAPGGDRINTLFVVLLTALIFIIFAHHQRITLLLLGILVVNAAYSSVEKVSIFQQALMRHTALCRSLSMYNNNSKTVKYISYFSAEIPTSHSYFFYRYGIFGKDTTVVHSGIVASDYRDWLKSPQDIISELSNDTLTVSSNNVRIDIHWDKDFRPKIVGKEIGKVRGFSKISMVISDTIDRRNTIFLAPADTLWTVLK